MTSQSSPAASRVLPSMALVVAALLAAACATGSSGNGSAGEEPVQEPQTIYALGVPLNAVPPVGKCRIWRPGKPQRHQTGFGSCPRLERRVPQDGWLLRHPEPAEGQPDRVELVFYRGDEPSLVRVFGTEDGKLIRERGPREEADQAAVAAGEETAAEEEDEASGSVEERIERGRSALRAGRTLYALEIPRAAVPAGECRIWRPGRPEGRQEGPGSCAEIRRSASPGVWVLRHEEGEGGTERLVVSAWGEGGPVLVRTFDASDGTLIEEEVP